MRGPTAKPLTERFWSRVVKTETCWLYGGSGFGNKYGHLSKGPGLGTVLAHRFSYESHIGQVPRGKFVCHACDVRNCVNPAHLRVGDHEDNNQDRLDRDRTGRNAARRVSKKIRALGPKENRYGRALNPKLRAALVGEYRSGRFTQEELAIRYRVSQATVSVIIKGRSKGGGGKKRSGHYRRKLSPESLQQIRELYATGKFTQQQLAERFGCDQTYVSLLVKASLS